MRSRRGILLILIACALPLGIVGVAVRYGDLPRHAHRTWVRWFGPTAASEGRLQRHDSVLGWSNRAGSSTRHVTPEYDVWYRVDDDGARRIPGVHPTQPIVEILGGSFAFGQGVADDETFGAWLQHEAWPDARVRIRATLGWGTAQAYLALRQDLERGDPIALALYLWLPFHNSRNHLSEQWLVPVGEARQRLPHFVVREGRPVFERFVDRSDALPMGPEVIETEWEITLALLSEMNRQSLASGTRFVVVLAPFEQRGPNAELEEMRRRLTEAQIPFVVAHGAPGLDPEGLYFAADGHPNAAWHRRLGAFLASEIEPPSNGGGALPPKTLGAYGIKPARRPAAIDSTASTLRTAP